MRIKSGPPSLVDARRYGKYFRHLLEQREFWIRRRVDQVVMLSSTRQQVSYSFDIDVSYLIRLALKSGLSPAGGLLVPLLILPREIIAGIDVKDQRGVSLNVLKRTENGFLTHSSVLAALRGDESEEELKRFDDYIATPGEVGLAPSAISGGEVSVPLIDPSEYAFTVVLPVDFARIPHAVIGGTYLTIIKVQLTEVKGSSNVLPSQWQGSRFWPRASFTHSISRISPSTVHSHLRIEIPDGFDAYHASFRARDPRFGYADAGQFGSLRITPELVVANAENERSRLLREASRSKTESVAKGLRERAESLDRITVFCRVSTKVISPVLYSLLVTVVTLTGFLILESSFATFSGLKPGGESSIASILAVAPTLVALYAGYRAVHFKVQTFVGMYRLALIVAAVSLIGFAFVVTTTKESEFINAALIASLSVVAFLLASVFVGWISMVSVARVHSRRWARNVSA